MKIDISDILKTDGASLHVEFDENFEDIRQYGDIVLNAPVSMKATLTNSGGILKLDGRLKTHFTGKCSKCLKNVENDLDLKISETIVNGKTSDDIEAYTYEGKLVDLDRIIKDNIILSLPMKLLCQQNCKGICPVCGCDRNVKSCDCSQEDINPQMEALKKFFDN